MERVSKPRQLHDWIKKDCYHTTTYPLGYCDRDHYVCRKCNKEYRCAEILPPDDKYCSGEATR